VEWWFNNSGDNLLKGVEGDTTNPIRLSDTVLVDFLRRIPAARESFNRLVPNMLEDEQTRLREVIAGSAQNLSLDYLREDSFQSLLNKAGVRTAGRFGGTRRGGN
jgi:hypothetical protein